MRNDLLDAKASVDWAEAHIPILQERFTAWHRNGPYEVVVEPDPNPAYELLVAYQRVPLDPLISPEVGAIINAARSSLDLLAAALAMRNGIKPSRNTHFPIFKTAAGAADPSRGLNSVKLKKWLSPAEIASIKALQPYGGGDEILFLLHELDVLRKHERLIVAQPEIKVAMITWPLAIVQHVMETRNNKTVLYRLHARTFRPTKGNAFVTAQITFHEPTLGLHNQPALIVLRGFVQRANKIISLFDIP